MKKDMLNLIGQLDDIKKAFMFLEERVFLKGKLFGMMKNL